MKRTLAVVGIGLVWGCGAATPHTSEPHDLVAAPRVFECVGEDPDAGIELDLEALEACLTDAQARSVARFVFDATGAEHDVDAYLALFMDDAVRTFARWEPESPHDITLDRAHFESLLRATVQGYEDPYAVSFARIAIELDGERARVRVITTYRSGGGEDTSVEGQEYLLDRHGTGWRIGALRTWLRGWGITDEGEIFTDATWPERDRAVELARAQLDAALPDSSRALRDALAAARQYREALEVARTLSSGSDARSTDWRRHAEIARAAFELEEAASALARAPGARLPSLDEVMRGEVGCVAVTEADVGAENTEGEDEEEEYDEEEESSGDGPCRWEVVASLEASDASSTLRAVAIVHLFRGEEEAESHQLLIGVDGDWHAGPQIADGPFVGNQVVGVMSFELSEATLRQVVPGGDDELVAHYHTEVNEDDVETEESGLLVCGALADVARCARVPESIRESTGGERPRTATATLAFDVDGSLRVTRRSGRSARIVAGTRAFEQLLDDAEGEEP